MLYPLSSQVVDVLDRLPWIAAVIAGPNPRVEYGNPRFQRLFGCADAMDDCFKPSEAGRSVLRVHIEHVLATGVSRSVHRFPVHPAGDMDPRHPPRLLDIRLHHLQDREAGPGAVLLCAVDVTHRVNAAHTLAARERLHRRLLRSVSTTYWESDPSGQEVRDVDTHLPLPPVVGVRGLEPDPGTAATRAARRTAMRAHAIFTSVRGYRAADGTHALFTRAVPQLDTEGGVARWLGVDIDVTEMVRAAQKSGSMKDDSEELALRVQALRGFSHDIRNVLHAADGFAQLMEEEHYGPLTEDQLNSLHRIRGLFGNAMVLITNMLETERARLTGTRVDHVPTEIIGLVHDCVEGHRAQAELGNLVLSVHSSLGEVWTRTDPVRVRQILDNLLSNAVKFTNAGGIAIDVRIQAKPGADSRRTIQIAVSDTGPGIAVSDTGPGIAAVDQERIFEEFERAGPKNVPGQGIGLAMSRILAHVVGGEITVKSDPKAGSTFALWLPLDPSSTSEHPTGSPGLMEPPSQAAS